MIIRFEGNQRDGKTLSMSLMGLYLQSEFPNQPIYANFKLNKGWVIPFTHSLKLKEARNAIVLFDEINTAFDSRDYKNKDVIEFTHLFQQFGKRGVTFLYSTQRVHTLEKRIRDNTDYIIECIRLWPKSTIKRIWYDSRRNAEIPVYIKTDYIRTPELFYSMYDSFETIESE